MENKNNSCPERNKKLETFFTEIDIAYVKNYIKKLIKSYRITREESDDIYQNVCISIIKKLDSGSIIKKPQNYLMTSVNNYILKLSRRQKKEKIVMEMLRYENKENINLERCLLDGENFTKIRCSLNILKSLSFEDFQLIHMFYFENKSWKEITNELNRNQHKKKSCSSVRKRGNRAKTKLKKIIHSVQQSL